jgi:hypothetical protein
MDNENLATIPVENEQVTEEVTQEVTEDVDGSEATPEPKTESDHQVDFVEELKTSGQIPKGVEPFRDENGELKFIIPINGKKYVANFKQVLSGFNLNTAGEQKLQAGKELEKKFERILDNIAASNPNGRGELKKFLTKLGYDLGDLSEGFLNDVIAERSMTPEEADMKRRAAELEEREAKLKEKEQEQNLTQEQKAVFEKQQTFTTEILGAMKAKKLENTTPELRKTIMQGVISEMINARHADHDMNAEEALDSVLMQFDMLLDNLGNLYSMEHLKRRLPKQFRELVMKLSLEDGAPQTLNSIHPGGVEVDESQLKNIEAKKLQKPKKKILLSEF